MILSEIVAYVKDRTGDTDDAIIKAEITNALKRWWLTTDPEGSLFEVDTLPGEQRVITLPWYVFQIKAVRRMSGVPETLLTPRRSYQPFNERQSLFEWRVIGRRPITSSLVNGGPITLELPAPAGVPFTVTIRGPSDFGVDTYEDISFSATETIKTTTGSYTDVRTASKSSITPVDVNIKDITGADLGVIPASQFEARCIVIQVTDKYVVPTNVNCNMYTVLFKWQPPVLQSDNDAVDDEVGLVLQDMAVSGRLSIRSDDKDQSRSDKFAGKAAATGTNVVRKIDEGREMQLSLPSSPFTTLYGGHL